MGLIKPQPSPKNWGRLKNESPQWVTSKINRTYLYLQLGDFFGRQVGCLDYGFNWNAKGF